MTQNDLKNYTHADLQHFTHQEIQELEPEEFATELNIRKNTQHDD